MEERTRAFIDKDAETIMKMFEGGVKSLESLSKLQLVSKCITYMLKDTTTYNSNWVMMSYDLLKAFDETETYIYLSYNILKIFPENYFSSDELYYVKNGQSRIFSILAEKYFPDFAMMLASQDYQVEKFVILAKIQNRY